MHKHYYNADPSQISQPEKVQAQMLLKHPPSHHLSHSDHSSTIRKLC